MIITIDDVVVVTNVIDVDAVVIAASVLALAVEGVVVTVIYRLILLLFFTISNIIISIRVIVVAGIDVDAYALVEEAIIITVIVAGVNCFGRSIVIVITVTGAGAGCSCSCSRSSIRGRNRNTAKLLAVSANGISIAMATTPPRRCHGRHRRARRMLGAVSLPLILLYSTANHFSI